MRARTIAVAATVLLLAMISVVALLVGVRRSPPRSEICGVTLQSHSGYEWIDLGERYGETPPEHEVAALLSSHSVPVPRSIDEVLVDIGALSTHVAPTSEASRDGVVHLGTIGLPDDSCLAQVTSWSGEALRKFYPGLDGGALITIVAVRH